MTQLFNRWLPALTFAAWGSVTLFLGAKSTYLAEPFTLYAQIAGVVMLLCAVVLAITRPDVACCAEAACGHGLSRSLTGKICTFAIVALPLALMPMGSATALVDIQAKNRKAKETISASEVQNYKQARASQRPKAEPVVAINQAPLPGPVSPPPLLPLPEKEPATTTTVLKELPAQPPGVSYADALKQPPPQPGVPLVTTPHPAAQTQESFRQYFDKSPEGNMIVEVLDLVYGAQDQVLMKDFDGQRVEMVVQYMLNPRNKPGGPIRFKGVRMFMQCCTADARPVATLVEVDKLPDFPEMTWVKVVGTATFPIERGNRTAVLKAEKVEKTEPPAETMLQ